MTIKNLKNDERKIWTPEEVVDPRDISRSEQFKEIAAEITGTDKRGLPQFPVDRPEQTLDDIIAISTAEETQRAIKGNSGGGMETRH